MCEEEVDDHAKDETFVCLIQRKRGEGKLSIADKAKAECKRIEGDRCSKDFKS